VICICHRRVASRRMMMKEARNCGWRPVALLIASLFTISHLFVQSGLRFLGFCGKECAATTARQPSLHYSASFGHHHDHDKNHRRQRHTTTLVDVDTPLYAILPSPGTSMDAGKSDESWLFPIFLSVVAKTRSERALNPTASLAVSQSRTDRRLS